MKHLLLRPTYNLLLPDLCATLLGAPLSLESTGGITLALYCAVPYMAASVVVSGTVFWDRSHDVYMPPNRYWYCALGHLFLFLSAMCSVFFILSMTFEHFYSILRPHKAASFHTVKKAKIIITLIVVFSIIFNLPHLFISVFDGERCIPYGKVVGNFNNLSYY